MNIGWVLRGFGGVGGTEKYAADLAGHLVARGHEIHVYAARVDPAAVARTGVVVHPMEWVGRGWRAERRFHQASRSLARGSHQVVQGFGRTEGHDVYRAGGGVHAAWLQARCPDPVRRLLARVSPAERWACRVDRAAAREARIVICNSEQSAAEVCRWHDIPEARVKVVRNGVDGERFRPDPSRREQARAHWQIPTSGRVALFLGSGFRRKGLSVAVEAFARVGRSADRLVVIGRDARAASRLRRARRRLGERLIVQGPTTEPERWLPGADATLLPSLYDSAANTTIEAMSCGVPPVTSGRDGSSEVVVDPRLTVDDPTDVEGFGLALEFAWETDQAEACRAEAARWTVARNGESVEAIYRQVANG